MNFYTQIKQSRIELNGAENVLIHCVYSVSFSHVHIYKTSNSQATHTTVNDLGLIKGCEKIRNTEFSHLAVFKMKNVMKRLPELNI